MSKKLIIAEKHTLAKNAMDACKLLGESFKTHAGYFESDEYVISYAIGHLFTLYDVEDYIYADNKKHNWSESKMYLPFMPDEFKFKLKDDLGFQYKILKGLIDRDDVGEIYHLGDADREGEVIIRVILMKANNKKPVYRIWGEDQTPKEIIRCIKERRKDCEFDSLSNEGFARMYMDWMLGINLTRMLSLKMGGYGQLRVGRVLVPIVNEIYERDKEIADFVPQTYFEAQSHEGIDLTFKSKEGSKAQIEELCSELNKETFLVKKIEERVREIKHPKLFSLSKLQAFMGEKYKWSPDETLNCAEKLYLNGLISYPRTNTEYLSLGEKEKIKTIVEALWEQAEGGLVITEDKSVFDSSKVESHSAIIPTGEKPTKMEQKEELLYKSICKRFFCCFSKEKMMVLETVITIGNDKHELEIKGEHIESMGFSKYEPGALKEKELPHMELGEVIRVNFTPTEKVTTPPKRHTIKTLLSFLTNPYRSEEYEDEYIKRFKGIEIGTEATRAGIIKNAIDCKYITLKNGTYSITELGKFLIESLKKTNVDLFKEKSIEFSKALIAVRENRLTIMDFLESCFAELKIMSKQIEKANMQPPPTFGGSKTKGICECPYCRKQKRDGEIFEGEYNFYCSNNTKSKGNTCDFSLSKKAVEKLTGKKINIMMLKKICERGEINISLENKKQVRLYLSQNGKYTNLSKQIGGDK